MMTRLWVLIAGPYTAPTAAQRLANLDRLNAVAREVYERGHIPMIGLNCAIPVVGEDSTQAKRGASIMDISFAVADRCDAVLQAGFSPGADAEVQRMRALGKLVYRRVEDLPRVELSKG